MTTIFHLCSKLSPLGKGCGPLFKQTWIPFTQGCFVPSWVETAPAVLEKKIFNFRYFVIIFLWKRACLLIWTKGFYVPSMVEIGLVVLEFNQCIIAIMNSLPLEKSGALYFNKLESPSPKDALCQVKLKLAQWFLRRR